MSYLGRNEGEGGISRGKGKQIVQSGLFMGPTRSPVPDHCSLGHNNNFTASVAPTVGGPGVSNLALAGASGPLLLAVMGRWCHHYPLLPLQWAMKNTNLLCITSSDGNLQNWNVLTTLFFFFFPSCLSLPQLSILLIPKGQNPWGNLLTHGIFEIHCHLLMEIRLLRAGVDSFY